MRVTTNVSMGNKRYLLCYKYGGVTDNLEYVSRKLKSEPHVMALIRGGEGVEGTGHNMRFLEKQEN